MNTLAHNSAAILPIHYGVQALTALLTQLRNDAAGYFPKPIQAERLILNALDSITEAQVLMEVPPTPGFTMAHLEALDKALEAAGDDLNRIHDLNHVAETATMDVILGDGNHPFFRVEAIMTTYSATQAMVHGAMHTHRALFGLSAQEQEEFKTAREHHGAHGPTRGIMISGLDGAPPEIIQTIIRQLRERLEGRS